MSNYRAPQAQQAPAARTARAPAHAPPPHAEGATGAPLPQAMRRQMEEAFGASFNGVRLDVNRSAEARGARAFAQGTRITVAPGEWSTGGRSVSRLIAHELAHVQQQRAGRVPGKGGAVNADAALEAEADAAAERVVNGSAANVRGGDATLDTATAPVQLQRRQGRSGLNAFAPRAPAPSAAPPHVYDDLGAGFSQGAPPAKHVLSAKALELTQQRPGNAAGVGRAAPIKLPDKYDNEQNVAGWRAFLGASEEQRREPARIALSQRDDLRVTRHFSPQEQAARTLRPQGGALVGGIARKADGSLPKSTYAMSPNGTSVADGGAQRMTQLDRNGLKPRTVDTHHSSMFNGGDVLHAGHIATNAAGKVNYLDNDSGHYRPGEANMKAAFDTLHGQGVLDPQSTSGRVNFVDASATKGIAGSGSGAGEASVHFDGYRQAGGNEAAIRARMQQRKAITDLSRNHGGRPVDGLKTTKNTVIAPDSGLDESEKRYARRKHLAQITARRTADS